jgi:hypothetical protein
MKPEFARQIFENAEIWSFTKPRQVVAGLFYGDRRTDTLAHMVKLIVAFHNFADVPKTFPLWRPPGWNRHSIIPCDFAQWYWSPCSSSLSSCTQRYVYPFKFYVLLLLAFVLPRVDLDLNLHINLPPFVCHVPHVRIHNWHYTTMA